MGKSFLQWSQKIYKYSNNEYFYKLSQQYPKKGFSKDINCTTISTTPNKQNKQTNKSMVVDDLVVVVDGVVEMGRQHVAGGGRG